jgi:DNA modification methylase
LGNIQLLQGDCLEVMRTFAPDSMDSIVTDPPYGLSFMGKDWDHGVPGEHFWAEALRVAKPGAHLLAFGGTRTFHRLAVAIEDAGWEIRDCVMWVYGSGFPKSHDVSKAIDREAGKTREVVGSRLADNFNHPGTGAINYRQRDGIVCERVSINITSPATQEAERWQGWGTALKPAWEPIIVARKPITQTVAANVLEWGTGAINVDGCRVEHNEECKPMAAQKTNNCIIGQSGRYTETTELKPAGRWPSNFIHDGSDDVLALMPETKSGSGDKHGRKPSSFCASTDWQSYIGTSNGGDSGSAARFFYCAKASKHDRDEGCEGLEVNQTTGGGGMNNTPDDVCGKYGSIKAPAHNPHPTVKPTDLMRYLCRLVTPPGGIILDPFMGSGSTLKAAVLEGFDGIGIDLNPEYVEIARRRVEFANSTLIQLQPELELV